MFIFISLLFLLVIILLLGFLLRKSLNKEAITIIFSIFALIISIYGAFRNEIYRFKLKIDVKELLIPAVTIPGNYKSFPIILPVQFINSGYGEGVIDDIVLLITGDKDELVKYYIPLLEVDLKEFLQGKRALHAENIVGTFKTFLITGKTGISKTILFGQEENDKEYPFSEWRLDKYKIDIYIKKSDSLKYKFYYSIFFEVTSDLLDRWRNNNSTSIAVGRKFIK